MATILAYPSVSNILQPGGTLGQPVPGGKLFTYLAGTTTKAPTYLDAFEVTQNTNPVIMDAAGQATVYLDGNTIYKFVFAPANDTDPPSNPFWTLDEISPTNPTSITTATQLSPGFTLTGDVTASTSNGDGNVPTTLATVNANVGQFGSATQSAQVMVNAKGLITAAGNVSITPQVAVFVQQETSGTNSPDSSLTQNAWTQRTLTSALVNTITGASLVGSGMTLPAGTYQCTGAQFAQGTTEGATRLFNKTAAASALMGLNTSSATLPIEGVFTLAAPGNITAQIWVTGAAANGGTANSNGASETYVQVMLTKIA